MLRSGLILAFRAMGSWAELLVQLLSAWHWVPDTGRVGNCTGCLEPVPSLLHLNEQSHWFPSELTEQGEGYFAGG